MGEGVATLKQPRVFARLVASRPWHKARTKFWHTNELLLAWVATHSAAEHGEPASRSMGQAPPDGEGAGAAEGVGALKQPALLGRREASRPWQKVRTKLWHTAVLASVPAHCEARHGEPDCCSNGHDALPAPEGAGEGTNDGVGAGVAALKHPGFSASCAARKDPQNWTT